MSITQDEARKVAHLARIAVPEDQLAALASELNGVLAFMDQLSEVDVEGVEPMTGVMPMRLKRREDVVSDGDYQKKILANAPDAREGFFAVPKVVE
ncbi:MAG: Asp-tRNA(Asn)/Glu-tRNA(Gln) amidotransferase subunit GatC [Paracoccus sp. (in: a-proteobacteria)]|nr:Asp-tRNA(Asn)/Glu-tRNA(Gln) amidotransferase subunit GatC [Paracoccus sp. (in: a-proteobacteria)]